MIADTHINIQTPEIILQCEFHVHGGLAGGIYSILSDVYEWSVVSLGGPHDHVVEPPRNNIQPLQRGDKYIGYTMLGELKSNYDCLRRFSKITMGLKMEQVSQECCLTLLSACTPIMFPDESYLLSSLSWSSAQPPEMIKFSFSYLSTSQVSKEGKVLGTLCGRTYPN